jgi:methyl-accepting chemotaxis protein
VSDIIGEIRAATSEQSQGIAQVNTAVNQLDQMTQQNSALVEQSAAAADSLREQAMKLAGVVATFRLAGGTAHAPVPTPIPARSPSPAPAVRHQPAAKLAPLKSPAGPKNIPTLTQTAAAPAPRRPAPTAPPKAGDDGDWESF